MPAVESEQVGSRGSSSHDHRTTGVDSQAHDNLKATSADVKTDSGNVPSAAFGDKVGGKNNNSVASTSQLNPQLQKSSKLNDLMAMTEDEHLSFLQSLFRSMVAFAKENKNVHKELKDNLGKADLVMNYYLKAKFRPKPLRIGDTAQKIVKKDTSKNIATQSHLTHRSQTYSS